LLIRGDRNQHYTGIACPQRACDVVSADLRHSNIQDHDVGMEFPSHLQGLGAVVGGTHLMAFVIEDPEEAVRRVAFIVGDEHPQRRTGPG
jgi:hypothetical protein